MALNNGLNLNSFVALPLISGPVAQVLTGSDNLYNANDGSALTLDNVYVQGSPAPPRVKRKLTDKLNEIVSVTDFGAVGDGVFDDAAAIQAAIDFCKGRGGGRIYVPAGRYLIGSTLTITTSNIELFGDGHPVWLGSTGTPRLYTNLIWKVSSGALPMLKIESPAGPSNVPIQCVSIMGLGFLGQQAASYCIQVGSLQWGTFDFYAERSTTSLFYTYVVTPLSVHGDVQHLNVSINGLQTSGTGSCVLLTGSLTSLPAPANTSLNRFERLSLRIGPTNDGIVLQDTDHNTFDVVDTPSTGASAAIRFKAGDGSSFDRARKNIVNMLVEGTSLIVAEGTETNTVPSQSNIVKYINLDGSAPSAPQPTIGTGATLFWGDDNNIFNSQAFAGLAVGDTFNNAASAFESVGSASLRVVNASSNHIVLADPTATNQWIVRINSATSNFELVKLSGAGVLSLPNQVNFGGALVCTSKATPPSQAFGAVTANGTVGVLTFTVTTAPLTSAVAVVSNTRVNATSQILVSIQNYSGAYFTNGSPHIAVSTILSGSFSVVLNNLHASNALSGTLIVMFLVIN